MSEAGLTGRASSVLDEPREFADEVPKGQRDDWGAAVWLFGSFLWGYVVCGELVLRFHLPEAIAVVGLVLVLLVNGRALRSAFSDEIGMHAATPFLFAAGLFVLALIASSVLFSSASSESSARLTLGLWALSVGSYFWGRRRCLRQKPQLLRQFAWKSAAVWVPLVLVTTVGVASALSDL